MDIFVLDTSLIVKWFCKGEKGCQKAADYFQQIISNQITVFLPELAKYELSNVLLKGKQLDYKEAKKILSDFFSLPINFISETKESILNSYKIAQKLNITLYDASFLFLAKSLNATLVTANPRHQKSIYGIKVKAINS
ncbi:type II toxin-antitoxin system VapC family toxin [Patescibacteria group bacterium]|nr:type II toxin-antitoxin system VapC family toxin [Patescibacteria group bacterium]